MFQSRERPRQSGGGPLPDGQAFPDNPAEVVKRLRAVEKRLEEIHVEQSRRYPCPEKNGEVVGCELKCASLSG
jgi:hypothetical protein